MPSVPEKPHTTLLLASGSPRRRELLERLGFRFEIQSADLDETPRKGESPKGYVKRLAREKAAAVHRRRADPNVLVLAADTSVVLDGEILGKPEDPQHAAEMLRRLSGKTHAVYTGVAIAGAVHDTLLVETAVTFRDASDEELRWYVGTKEPLDKAGAYAIQGIGAFLIDRIEGSPTNVIGLPLVETLQLLQRGGIAPAWSSR